MIPAGTRRTKIRPPRKASVAAEPASRPFDYDTSWQILAAAIGQIQNKNVSTLSYEQLYRIAYTVVLQKCGERLYEDVSGMISGHLRRRRAELLRQYRVILAPAAPSASPSAAFLKAVADEWQDHLQSMRFISDVLMYMNRVYVKDSHKMLVQDLGVVLFESDFLRANDSEMARLVVSMVCEHVVSGGRPGPSQAPVSHVSSVVAMFEAMADKDASLYSDGLEAPLVARSRAFYADFAAAALAARSGSSYVRQVSDLIAHEEKRLAAYSGGLFAAQTQPKLVAVMDEILIRDNLDKVMALPAEMSGLSAWLAPVLESTLSQRGLVLESTLSQRGLVLESTLSQRGLVSGSPPVDLHHDELSSLYTLEGRVDPERKRLKTHLRNVIVSQGLQLPHEISHTLEQRAQQDGGGAKKSAAGPHTTAFALEWIDAILQYQKCLGVLVQSAFQSDPSVEFTVFASLKQFINGSALAASAPSLKKKDVLNAPELLSVYMDHHIKQASKVAGAKKTPDVDFLNKAICFLKLVEDKHAFETHYAAHFAKRFLNAKGGADAASSPDDMEDLVISKLWDEVFLGSHHLERIVKMRKDVKSSAELTSEWRQFAGESDMALLDLDLKICNLAEWPKSMTRDHQAFGAVDGSHGFIWPKQLRPTMKVFEEFWLTGKRNDNKALYWYPKFGSMDLRITYPSRTYDINLSTYAGIVMLLFAPQSSEDGHEVSAFEQQIVLTYTEIYELTRIPEADLKRQLRSIAVAPRSRLLVKSPMSKDISASDTFQLNAKFKSPSSKVKVLTVKAEGGDKPDEADEVQNKINDGKQHLINASIVRVMKSRQTIKHNDLVQEIIKQLQSRFLPSMIHIKQRIEDLIEKEYLRRDTDLPSVYHYIA